MKTDTISSETFDKEQVLKTLKTSIATSRKTLMDDGILLLSWGLVMSLGFFWKYYNSIVLVPSRIRDVMSIINIIAAVGIIAFTIYFIFFRTKRVKTYTAISTRFVWLGVILAHNLNVIVTKSSMNEINFEILHPLQMVLIGFALFVTGGIYRYYLLVASGVIMWIGAAVSANYDLNTQFLVRAIADFVCFVIPGVLMYSEIKKKRNV
ncbi:hypothetical protein [uncultured Draconibacterium sp.]|uniref:hypothetical protein n=1 Tax=uncultured Draconibacterium sp. TaxID=1573823 RepID=UPI0032168A70